MKKMVSFDINRNWHVINDTIENKKTGAGGWIEYDKPNKVFWLNQLIVGGYIPNYIHDFVINRMKKMGYRHYTDEYKYHG